MATTNLSEYDSSTIPDASGMCIGIVVSEWNKKITGSLLKGAVDTLKKHGVEDGGIFVEWVPGSFELPFGAKSMADNIPLDAVILLGSVVRGGTPHFDYVCQGVTQGAMQLNMDSDIPFIFGVLTTDDMQQAEDRAGGVHGNKGDEAAITAIKMVDLVWRLEK